MTTVSLVEHSVLERDQSPVAKPLLIVCNHTVLQTLTVTGSTVTHLRFVSAIAYRLAIYSM